ncbi:MAG: hypothetical protein RMK20_06365 [Verrucomicrobiales bacterium]|nr:hypothetical protein [Verrucomicrobiales bacterium]
MERRYPWLWDTDLDNEMFEAILRGEHQDAQHDALWAMCRLIEYAPFGEIKRLLPRELFLREWPRLAPRIRSEARRRGMDFFYRWLQEHACG